MTVTKCYWLIIIQRWNSRAFVLCRTFFSNNFNYAKKKHTLEKMKNKFYKYYKNLIEYRIYKFYRIL